MLYEHAIVIGGSVGGMCAAQALAPFFKRVTIIDRDVYPERAEDRAGVAQSRHAHGLLARGRQGVEELFPGFRERMLARGGNEVDFPYEFAHLRATGWQQRTSSGVHTLFASRALIEYTIRELLQKTTNITLLNRVEVIGLKTAPGPLHQVTGIRVRRRGNGSEEGEGAFPSEIEADLVVDASGRSTRAPEWLRELSAEAPEETVVDCFSGYSTRWYQAPPDDRWPSDWWWRKGIWIDPLPPDHLNGATIFAIEDNRWIVTLIGYAGQYPPSDEAGFDEALRKVRTPAIAEAVALAQPISPVYCTRAHANRFRRYELLDNPIGGFVALGDSVCVFNPAYGQGMSASVISALTLASCIRTTTVGLGPGLARTFFREQAKALEGVWATATGADFSIPGTQGEPPKMPAILKRYMGVLFDMARVDPVILRQTINVVHLLKPGSALLELPVAARVTKRMLQDLWRGGGQPEVIPPMPPPAMPVG